MNKLLLKGSSRRRFRTILSLVLVATLLIGVVNFTSIDAKANTADPSRVTFNQDGIAGSKSVVNNADGTININFSVTGANTTTPTQKVTDTNIVFVMDISASMVKDNKANQRLLKAKEAAKKFVSEILTDENKEHVNIGVASFNNKGYINQNLTNNATTVNSAINKLSADGGTNIQAGIQAAMNILAADTRSEVNQIIIILSDGEPTYSYQATEVATESTVLNDGSSIKMLTSFNSNIIGEGSEYTFSAYRVGGTEVTRSKSFFKWSSWKDSSGKVYNNNQVGFVEDTNFWGTEQKGYVDYTSVSNNGDPTISEANLAKNKNVTIYSIAYDTSNVKNAVYTMKNVASSLDKYYTASSTASGSDITSNAIANIMATITKEVNETIAAARGAQIIDKLPSYLTAIEVYPSEGTTAVIDNDQQVTWTIGELAANTTKTLTIRASLNKTAMLSANNKTMSDLTSGAWFNMNQEATFTYAKSDNKLESLTIDNPKLEFTTKQYTVDYYEDGSKISTSTYYQFIGDNASFGNTPAYASDTVKYNKSLTTAASTEVTLTGSDGNWSFLMPSNAVTVRVDYYKNEFTVNYFDNKSIENGGKGALLSSQQVKYGQDTTAPATDDLGYESNGFQFRFSNWDKDGKNITANTDILALYNSQKIKFVAEFYGNTGDTTPVDTQTVEMNKEGRFLVAISEVTPVYSGTLPEGVDHMAFDSWDFDFTTSISTNVKIYAIYKPVYKTFTVQFHDMDDAKTVLTGLTISNVTYGDSVIVPAYPNADLRTEDQVRLFTEWTNEAGNPIDLSSIKANTDVYASYTTVARYYKVTWNPDNGQAIEEDTVEYGGDASYDQDTPEKKASEDGQYDYTFNYWSNGTDTNHGSITNVTEDMSFVAQYSSNVKQYQYYFSYKDSSNTWVQTDIRTVDWGSTLEEPVIPTEILVIDEENGSETIYTFRQWDDNNYSTGIKTNGYATAVYDDVTLYDVTFNYANGSTTIKVEAGETIPFDKIPTGTTVDKASNVQYKYSFTGWDGDTSATIQGSTIFNAQYDENIIWYGINVNVFLDGSLYKGVSILPLYGEYGKQVSREYTEIASGLAVDGKIYQFDKIENASLAGTIFSYQVSDNNPSINIYFVEEPKFTITYYKTNMVAAVEGSLDLVPEKTSEIIGESDKVYAGEAISYTWVYDGITDAASFHNAKYTYSFAGWVDEDGKPFTETTVTENKNVYASFTPTINSYTVTFLDYKNGPDVAFGERDYSVVVAKQTVEYGNDVTIPSVPTREDTVQYHYTNHSWNVAESFINPVTKDLVVKAEHSYELQKYNIKFLDFDQTVIKDEHAEYGATIAIPTQPSRPDSADGHYYYTFDKWVEVITIDGVPTTGEELSTSSILVSGEATYQAVYIENEYSFKVTFLNEDGTYFTTQAYQAEVTWGQNVTDETKEAARALADAAAVSKSDVFITYTFANWQRKELKDGVETMVDATIKLNEAVTKDLTVYASYLDAKNVYTITYKYEDGSDLDTIKVTAGESYEVSKSGPTKGSSNTLDFTFSHWIEKVLNEDGDMTEKAISEVSSVERNYELYPVYDESTRLYKVDFVDYDGRSLGVTQHIEYGKSATAPKNPSRSDEYTSTTRRVYTFSGWDVDYSKIKADTTVTAKYNEAIYDISPTNPVDPTPGPTTDPTTMPTVAPTPVVEDIEGIIEDIPQGNPEIPQGTPVVDTEDDSLPADDTSDELFDIAGDDIPEGTPTLPQTGTAPVGIFYGIGVACALIGSSIMISGRKKKENV